LRTGSESSDPWRRNVPIRSSTGFVPSTSSLLGVLLAVAIVENCKKLGAECLDKK
jgi:hypothetical protein